MKMAEYMEQHIGEQYEGIITGVASFGMFVALPNMVEGLVKVEDITDDFYRYDESTFSLIGERTKKRYTIGKRVKVEAIAASKLAQTIDFKLV